MITGKRTPTDQQLRVIEDGSLKPSRRLCNGRTRNVRLRARILATSTAIALAKRPKSRNSLCLEFFKPVWVQAHQNRMTTSPPLRRTLRPISTIKESNSGDRPTNAFKKRMIVKSNGFIIGHLFRMLAHIQYSTSNIKQRVLWFKTEACQNVKLVLRQLLPYASGANESF